MVYAARMLAVAVRKPKEAKPVDRNLSTSVQLGPQLWAKRPTLKNSVI